MSGGWPSREKGNEFQAKGAASAKVLRQGGWSRVTGMSWGEMRSGRSCKAVLSHAKKVFFIARTMGSHGGF